MIESKNSYNEMPVRDEGLSAAVVLLFIKQEAAEISSLAADVSTAGVVLEAAARRTALVPLLTCLVFRCITNCLPNLRSVCPLHVHIIEPMRLLGQFRLQKPIRIISHNYLCCTQN